MKRLYTLALVVAAVPAIAQQPAAQQSQALPPEAQQVARQQTPQAQRQAAPQGTVVEEIIARINNSIVTRADLQRSKDAWQEDVNKASAQGQEAPKEADLLRDLIDQQLLIQKATELGISADTDLVKRLDQIRQQIHADSLEDLEKAAQAQGVSFEDFKQNIKNGLIQEKVIQQEVGGRITVTQQEIQQYYDLHKTEMERPEQVRLSEILISTQKTAPVKTEQGKTALPPAPPDPQLVETAQKKADSVYQQLQSGAKFADLAKANSDGPTAPAGGDLEYFKRGTLSKELEDKVFALQAGQYTQPIRTNQGWVILEVTEHQAAGIPPLKDVAPMIGQRLYMTAMQPALRDYLTKLREDAYIDIKPGYVDTGASPNETKPIYTTAEASGSNKPAKKKKKLGLF